MKDQNVVIVTGGSRGIGRAIVERFAREGSKVYFTYVSSEEAAADVIRSCNMTSRDCAHALRVDGRDKQECESFVKYVMAKEGHVEVLVNNAAVTRDKLLALMSDDEWDTVLETSLNGLFATTRPVAKAMMRAKYGRIINITSVSGVVGIPGQTNYSTAKAGIIGFTQSLAQEVASYGVSVNAIAPGFIDTDMLSFMTPDQREKNIARVPMRRFGTPDEVAQLTYFLGSNAPSFMTGQTLVVDGGMTG